jgi:hypothetical protein
MMAFKAEEIRALSPLALALPVASAPVYPEIYPSFRAQHSTSNFKNHTG